MNTTDRLWYVQLPDGDVHRVTLDQLDEGFQSGHIDERTMVLAAGASRWTPLGELAGIDAPSYPASFDAPPSYPVSHRPVSVDLGDLEVLAALPRRSSKRWLVAVVVLAVVGSAGAVAVKRPSWSAPYWRRLEPQGSAMKSWAAAAIPSLVGRVRNLTDKEAK